MRLFVTKTLGLVCERLTAPRTISFQVAGPFELALFASTIKREFQVEPRRA